MSITNSYLNLGDEFYQRINPSPVYEPNIFLWNARLEKELQLSNNLNIKPQEYAQIFSGNKIPEGSEPIAMAYAGHQFGGFSHQLGDGRAHLLGELKDIKGQLKELQLKGSGATDYSRRGDGRYALGPAIREFIMSESMFALGVPTTTSLSVVTTGESVYRESIEQGAVLARVASSHLRVGTFEYFAARQNTQAIEKLTDFTITKHFPELKGSGSERYILMLEQVIKRQINLVVEWMRVGFIHGVMNTDNTTISGETIDYGPCAMMGLYDPKAVFSSIDHQSRYAFGNQANIVQWNMTRFAETLLPLIDKNQDKAIAKATEVIERFSDQINASYFQMMANKLGINQFEESDKKLISELLKQMEIQQMDYTISFTQLTELLSNSEQNNETKTKLENWLPDWMKRLDNQGDFKKSLSLMQQSNPIVIARNHHIENTIQACLALGDGKPAQDFIKVLCSPYKSINHTENYQDSSAQSDRSFKTFCGT